MGTCQSALPQSHHLYSHFLEYEEWIASDRPEPIPDQVIALASYSAAIRKQRNQFADNLHKKHLRNRLCDGNLVKGLLNEFMNCIHFDGIHRRATWLANIGQVSEADIRVERQDGHIFYVECTAKNPKQIRARREDVIMTDILASIQRKRFRPNRCHPVLLAIYFPEELDLIQSGFRTRLGERIHRRFQRPEYGTISAVAIISHRSPQFAVAGGEIKYYDTDLLSLTYPNPAAFLPLRPGSINPNGI